MSEPARRVPSPADPAPVVPAGSGELEMDFSLTDEQQALVDTMTRILGDRMTIERLKERDASDTWYDLDTWAELGKADLLGVAVPERAGGLGYGILELCLLLEEAGRTVAPLPLVPALISAALPVTRFGTADQVTAIGALVRGEVIGTAALVEPGADPVQPVTRADRDGDRWRIVGEKTLVPAVNVAATILVPATVDGEVGMFVVPKDAPGVTVERQQVMGKEPHFHVRLDGVVVADGAHVGTIEHGREMLATTLAHTRVALCALAAGVADRAVRITAEYVSNRHQFGRPIATFQAVESRLAEAYIHAQAMHLTMLLAATRLAEGRDATLEVATAKYWAAEGGNFVGHTALHCHGGISIDLDYPIHRYFLWAKQIEHTLGAVPEQLRTIGRVLADAPA